MRKSEQKAMEEFFASLTSPEERTAREALTYWAKVYRSRDDVIRAARKSVHQLRRDTRHNRDSEDHDCPYRTWLPVPQQRMK